MTPRTTILGIESSCDDTGAALVRVCADGRGEILSNVVSSQTELHRDFGGVVPEIAARAHVEKLDLSVEKAMSDAGLAPQDLAAIAVTAGPGLIGGLMAGVSFAKALAVAWDVPILGINHLAGHALTPRLTDAVSFPYLMLLVSGGHCQFLRVEGPTRFTRLGGTIDDAPGEAFDKIAKALALPQPGGPQVEAGARDGQATIPLPRPLLDRAGCDMSFSGLKTAVLRARDAALVDGALPRTVRADLCASFQAAVADILARKSQAALDMAGDVTAFAVAGGVAANGAIRAALSDLAQARNLPFVAPPLALCTDNAAMIAWAGIERFRLGQSDGPDLGARPRWPLDQDAAPMLGSGKRGAKA
ncbi:tRNA (adenosine(37)-N6)-threonylcarbamoyltransferase complex transferase subunit TsaD [Maribius pontilimi]|uniref:tRNA N6-adenosine threonylcarbamoyltransferase n=1 Tax=Palleronia pontilimi TaxID=1964209 RepID=A0A934I9F3_9RHOB|nr:tRNA (adenosine(37)-N6)-threonylcarbamoyltransferase complex transferase subunit TsaD [Palleronia pontilimi]MBJ3761511.1 tRNA (adenosine(37)-N6)-threonylcarbamoyltransferase complex transferase subunit TsaD [Palleronia pontilimi]